MTLTRRWLFGKEEKIAYVFHNDVTDAIRFSSLLLPEKRGGKKTKHVI